MRKLAVLASALVFSLALQARFTINFNDGWRFHMDDGTLGETLDASAWRIVDLPHDWSIEGEFSKDNPTGQGGWLPAGTAYYLREVSLNPAEGERQFLEFDGIMSHSTVYVNGHEVGYRPNGYASFSYDITDYIKEGTNQVAVKVDASVQPASRWYTGCGINRNVRLVVKNSVHIPYQGIFTYFKDGFLYVEADARNLSKHKQKVRLEATLRDLTVVSDPVVVKRGNTERIVVRIDAGGLELWSPSNPALHEVSVRLLDRRSLEVDSDCFNVGLRTIRFDNETGFWLNGTNVKMYGVCLHSDAGALGTVTPLNVWRYRLTELRKLGVNAIRWAHNAADPELLKLCDEMGFLVMAESFDTWEAAKPHAEKGYNLHFREWWQQDTEDFVRSARNHPCVVIYSVGNEIRDNLSGAEGLQKYLDQQNCVHSLDPTRPVTMALFRPNSSGVYRNGFAEQMDVVGQNYRVDELKAYHEAHPSKAIIGTENTHDIQSWLMLRDDPSLCGQFLWTGIEYLGEAEWPQVSWNTALLDITGAVKPLGLQRKSWWTTEPMVAFARRPAPGEGKELLSDWSPVADLEKTTVEVYSNCQEVELLLNGRSLGRVEMPADARPALFDVQFERGELLVRAYNKGVVAAECKSVSAGAPCAIRLEQTAPGCIVTAYCVDAAGNVCPIATNRITFESSHPGLILATDNGDPFDRLNHQQLTRPAYQGRAVCYISSGIGTITATSPGLLSATLNLE